MYFLTVSQPEACLHATKLKVKTVTVNRIKVCRYIATHITVVCTRSPALRNCRRTLYIHCSKGGHRTMVLNYCTLRKYLNTVLNSVQQMEKSNS